MFKKNQLIQVVATAMVLSTSQATSSFGPFQEFEENRKLYPAGYLERPSQDISEILLQNSHHDILRQKGVVGRALSVDEAFAAEEGKARDPLSYIPFAVQKGMIYGETLTKDGYVQFHRLSVQRDFRDSENSVYVHELVTIDRGKRRALFLGREFTQEDLETLGSYKGLTLEARAPLFDVQHSTGITIGKDGVNVPLDQWQILRHIKLGEESPSIMEKLRQVITTPERMTQSMLFIYGEYLRQNP